MRKLNTSTGPDSVEMRCYCEEDEQLVVFELVVPITAKVPALSQAVAVTKVVQPASITSTGVSSILTPLRANNTAWSPVWCITPTLAATRKPSQLSFKF